MGPLLWWWHWWLGDDPNRDRQLTEARDLLDEQRSQSDELAGLVQARDSALEELRESAASLERRRGEADEVRAQLTAELDQARAENDELRARIAELQAEAAGSGDGDTADTGASQRPNGTPDVEAAREVLGTKVTANDLTVVEGVGPKIAGLLTDAGIDTWRALGDVDVERLRLVLAEAGPRYRMHDPSSWPTQGRLLADGRWQDFRDLMND